MSFYATLAGFVHYSDKEKFDEAVKLLKDGDWVDDDGFLLDENNSPVDPRQKTIREKKLTLVIPYGYYRNFNRVIYKLPEGWTGKIVGASTDGVTAGWVIVDGKQTDTDLIEWGNADNMEENCPDPDTETEEYVSWLNECADLFVSENF